MKTIYLAGPMDGRTEEEIMDWRERAENVLDKFYNFENPGPTRRDEYSDEDIVIMNKQQIFKSDIVLANCSLGPSFGTSMEIYEAYLREKEVYVITQLDSIWINIHATKIFKSVAEALVFLRKEAGAKY